MNAQQKTELVNSLIDNVRDDILSRIQHMPEDWDGLELRQYVADRFVEEGWFSKQRDGRRNGRYRSYRNEKATRMGL